MHTFKASLFSSILLISLTNVSDAFADYPEDIWMSLEAGVSFLQDPVNTTVQTMPGVNLPDNYVNTDQDHRDLSADFAKNTNTSFAWRLGVGVNLVLPSDCEGWHLGVLYRYADLGEAETGDSENYPTVGNLETQLISNEILASL